MPYKSNDFIIIPRRPQPPDHELCNSELFRMRPLDWPLHQLSTSPYGFSVRRGADSLAIDDLNMLSLNCWGNMEQLKV